MVWSPKSGDLPLADGGSSVHRAKRLDVGEPPLPDGGFGLCRRGWYHTPGEYQAGDLDRAAQLYRLALAMKEEKLGDNHPLVADSRRDLALLLFDTGETATAEVLWSRAMAVLRRQDGWEVADAESRLGERLLAQGRTDEALVCLRESWETLYRLRGEGAVVTQDARRRLDAAEGTPTASTA